jgi:hypothetical protein
MVIMRLLAIADVVEALIETSPLFDVHTRGPHPLPSRHGVAGGGARRSTNRLRIADRPTQERNPRDGIGMR